MMGGAGHATTTQAAEWPKWMQPYVNQYLKTGSEAIMPGGGMLAYDPATEQQVAGLNPEQLAAIQGIQDTSASMGTGAMDMINSTIAGDYLSPDTNPWLKGAYDSAASRMMDTYQQSVAPQLATDAARAGAMGGSGYAQEQGYQSNNLMHGLGDLASQIYGGAYMAERQNQMAAPGMQGAAFLPFQQALGASTIEQQQRQQMLDAGQANAFQRQQYPYQTLGQVGQFLGSASGPAGQSSATTPLKTGMLGFK